MSQERFVFVGGWPPPYGGNTVHLQRLVGKLIQDGHQVVVADPYNMATVFPSLSEQATLPSEVILRSHKGKLRLLGALAAQSRNAIVHLHMSAGRNFYRIAPILLALTGSAKRRILTIHSGSWAREFQALSPAIRRSALRTIASFDDVICVNEGQLEVLEGLLRTRLHLIPAYLPPLRVSAKGLPESIKALRKEVEVVAVTSGSGEPIYGLETVLQGVEQAQEQVATRIGLVMATYKSWDPVYWKPIEEALKRTPVRAVVTKDLDSEQFVSLLSNADLYIRGSLTDGDSITIREAASVGLRILATDAVTRPNGAALFSTGNARDLAGLIVAALEDKSLGRLIGGEADDNYAKILKAYGI